MPVRDIITAVPVAFAGNGALDLDGSRAILRYVAASGNEGAFVLGTTGEFLALSFEERTQLMAMSIEELSPHMRVIVHTGAASLYEVLRLTEHAQAVGATEIAVITPYYFPVTDTALRGFFAAVDAAANGLKVFIYSYRVRTGNAVSTELMADLASLPNIVGAKVSEEPLAQLASYRAVVPADFTLYTGADHDLARAAGFGAQGVVSGVSSVFPKPFRALTAAAESGDTAAMASAQAAVDDVVRTIGGDIARMKAAYALLGVPGGTTRMTIEPPPAEVSAELRRAVERYA